ncbi:MAG: hypothetical protein ABI232_09570 [Jatrophihabitantaceae bacterium]
MSSTEPPRRVRITHPRTDAVRKAPPRPASREINEQTSLGEVYMSSLIRAQRRLALVVCAIVAIVLFGIAMLGGLAPSFAGQRLFGLPVPWLLLGVLIYPVLIALALYTVRQAERNERAFSDLVRRR